jgi:magnesium chelatase family protein
MFVKVNSVAFQGLNIVPVTVEVNISNKGLPRFDIVGLPTKTIEESKLRVKTAFQNVGIPFPNKKITVNLAPADIHKDGSFYDLAIAVGIYCASQDLTLPARSLFFGEVSLDGTLRYTRGSFLLALYARDNDCTAVFIPSQCVTETAAISEITVFGVANLKVLLEHISGIKSIKCTLNMPVESSTDHFSAGQNKSDYLLEDIIGQTVAKRALIICAAGGHNLIMIGSPGVGKTMLAKCLLSILPPLTFNEAVEVTKIYSLSGTSPINTSLIRERPFRSPHHSITVSGLIGGGASPVPGEITLAHRGILFLDEINEFNTHMLDMLRQPMETGTISISRIFGSLTYPAKFTLVAAANPCPCGFFGNPNKECLCGIKKVEAYQHKISGPLMDRIDICVNLPSVDYSTVAVAGVTDGMTSCKALEMVLKARAIQESRFKEAGVYNNAEMPNAMLLKYCKLDGDAESLLQMTLQKNYVSGRGYYKILKLARTIADISDSSNIKLTHIAEAIQLRLRL